MSVVTNYDNSLISIYFFKILKTIIKIGNIDKKNNIILDFGCGNRKLKSLIRYAEVINYDSKKELSDHDSYKNLYCDIVVMNHVLMYLSAKEAEDIFNYFYNKNNKIIFIIGISKINYLSKLILKLVNIFTNKYQKSHDNLALNYEEQINLLKNKFNIFKKKNVFFLTDVFLLKFK